MWLCVGHRERVAFCEESLGDSRSKYAADDTVARLKAAAPDSEANVQGLVVDVTEPSSITAVVRHIRENFDQCLDCVVNNAGVNTVAWT